MAKDININVSPLGASILSQANPASQSWIRVETNGAITLRTAAQTLSDLGAQASGTYLTPADIGITVQGYSANTTLLGNTTTGTGAIVLANNPNFTGYLDIDEIADPAAPANTLGRLWASDTNGKTNLNFVGNDGIKQRIGRDIISTVRNVTGSTITKGTIVYVSGATGTAPEVTPARANSQTTLPAVGIAMEDIANNSFGRIQRYGRTEFIIDTSAFAVGTILYVSPSVAGAFTSTMPTYPNYPQSVGVVVVSGIGNGSVFVNFITDYNGHSSGTTNTTFTFGAAPATSVILANSSTAQRTATFRDASGYVALTDVNQSSFTLGVASSAVGSIVLHNATNAFTTTIQSGVAAASRTYTIPTNFGAAGSVLTDAAGNGTLSWAASASGISIGDAIGNSPVTGSALMAIGGVITQSISYRAQQATPFSTAFGFESHISGSFSGIYNTSFGYQAGKAITTGAQNTFIGALSGTGITTSDNNVGVGYNTLNQVGASGCVAIGREAGRDVSTSTDSIFIGYRSGYTAGAVTRAIAFGDNIFTLHNNTFCVGRLSSTTATNQVMFGTNDATHGGFNDFVVGQGNTSSSATGFTLRTTGGSGTNNAGGNLLIECGKNTGNSTSAYMAFRTPTAGASGTTLQTMAERARITSNTGNFLLGETNQNASATKALILGNGTEASALLANAICIQSQDTTAGLASLSIYVEDTVQAVGAETLSNFLRVRINGVEYKLAIIA